MKRSCDVRSKSVNWEREDGQEAWAGTKPQTTEDRKSREVSGPSFSVSLVSRMWGQTFKLWTGNDLGGVRRELRIWQRSVAVTLVINEFPCSCIGNGNTIFVGVGLFCDPLHLLVLNISFIDHIQGGRTSSSSSSSFFSSSFPSSFFSNKNIFTCMSVHRGFKCSVTEVTGSSKPPRGC